MIFPTSTLVFYIPWVITLFVPVLVIKSFLIFVISFSILFAPLLLAVWYSRGGHNISINLPTCYTLPIIQCVSLLFLTIFEI